jgi:ATP-dependent RNA helicase SUPV3L1/SUV3
MLERLADMIRERTFWKPAAPTDRRPEGSVEGGGFSVVADMMSLVGCSGADFAEILKSLGYKLERRKLPPAVVASALAEGGAPQEPVAAAPCGETGTPAPVAAETDPTPAAERAEVVEPQPAIAQGETETPAEAAPEPRMLEVWWPRDTGPFRRRNEQRNRPRGKPRHGADAGADAKQAGAVPRIDKNKGEVRGKGHRRPPRHGSGAPPANKPEPRIDKDSPFAILGELRSQLAARSRRGD